MKTFAFLTIILTVTMMTAGQLPVWAVELAPPTVGAGNPVPATPVTGSDGKVYLVVNNQIPAQTAPQARVIVRPGQRPVVYNTVNVPQQAAPTVINQLPEEMVVPRDLSTMSDMPWWGWLILALAIGLTVFLCIIGANAIRRIAHNSGRATDVAIDPNKGDYHQYGDRDHQETRFKSEAVAALHAQAEIAKWNAISNTASAQVQVAAAQVMHADTLMATVAIHQQNCTATVLAGGKALATTVGTMPMGPATVTPSAAATAPVAPATGSGTPVPTAPPPATTAPASPAAAPTPAAAAPATTGKGKAPVPPKAPGKGKP